MRFRIQHTSLQATDPDPQRRADPGRVLGYARKNHNVVALGTEAGTEPTKSALAKAAQERDYYCYIGLPGDSWVCVDKRWAEARTDSGFIKVINAGHGHGPRGVTWMSVYTDAGEMSFAAMHLLAGHSTDTEPHANTELRDAAVKWAKDHGPNAFISADTNTNDAKRNVWSDPALMTCWDELHKYPGTIETGAKFTIDVISRLRSSRAEFTGATRVGDTQFHLNSDHQLIEATVEV